MAKEYRKKGIELILFGSFAKGTASRVSDIDLAYTGRSDSAVESSLIRRIDDLPTIRAIDLVPLHSATDDLVRDVENDGIHLADE